MKNNIKVTDISNKKIEQLAYLSNDDFIPLPAPFDKEEELPGFKLLNEKSKDNFETPPDGVIAVGVKKIESDSEKEKIVQAFISGLKKLFTKDNNWTFLQPLTLSLEHCARCMSCSEACPIYEGSGYKEIYRPNYRAEILRRLYYKYVKGGFSFLNSFNNGNIELNFELISRLFELTYRCTLCRRCAQNCPIGVDNGLLTRELRKLFSQELGWYPKELHEKGSVQQLEVGSSTGMKPKVVKDNIEFIFEDFNEKTGFNIEPKWDIEGADVLVIHNAGEILSWPDNPACFALLMDLAGISWTMSSDIAAYDGVNYGLFYDDFQLAKVAEKHLSAAKKLKVKKILMGECGHESKAMGVIADRIFSGSIPREVSYTFLENIVFSGKIEFNPDQNYFPITLHDPCNITRSMGVIEPQRRILRKLAPKFREMTPHGVNNYCCGGGSGFAIMSGNNFSDWRINVAGRKKFKQILDAFSDCDMSPDVPKYVTAPCSNCKGQIRDMFDYFGAKEKAGLHYDGLAELIVNAISGIKEPLINFEDDF